MHELPACLVRGQCCVLPDSVSFHSSRLSPLLISFPLGCIVPTDAKHRAESELGPQTRPRSNTLPKSFGSTLEQSAQDTAVEMKGPRPTREETLELIQRRVKGKRQEDGWPDDIKVGYSPFGVPFRSTSDTHSRATPSTCSASAEDDQGAVVLRENSSAEEPSALRGAPRPTCEPSTS